MLAHPQQAHLELARVAGNAARQRKQLPPQPPQAHAPGRGALAPPAVAPLQTAAPRLGPAHGVHRRPQRPGQRRRVEAFHRRIKQQLGLAHLYSLQPVGIELQLEMAVLLVLLSCLLLADQPRRSLLDLLDRALQGLRLSAGLSPTHWRPNTPPGRRRAAAAKGGEATTCANH